MTLWMLVTLLTVLASVGLTVLAVRRYDAWRAKRSAISLEDLADPAAEQSPRPSVFNRLLESQRLAVPATVGLVFVGVLTAALAYMSFAKPQAGANAVAAADHPGGDVDAMIASLKAKTEAGSATAEDWRMLGWSYMQIGQSAEAAVAYQRASALEPENADLVSARAEALILAAGGQVTPAAAAALRSTLALNPGDPRARYFLAVQKDQAGDHTGAMNDWIGLLNSAPADAAWAGEVRSFVEQTAKDRGLNIAGRLVAAPAAKGPTEDQVASAMALSAEERGEMVTGMVDGLAARLKQNPNDPDGWAMLIRARMVQGQTAAAQAALADARKAMANSPSALTAIREAAVAAGVPGA